ncbi:RidA family protein [Gluconacetobacter sacchari]|uniref:RidA family protein n=1 Tax=Gluconacetobacter sacchari TaxID=92759 RepID=UPI0039B44081
MERQYVKVASAWGELIGYSRAVRAGNLICVSGTTATGEDGKAMHVGDVAAQARVILDRIMKALSELGAGAEHVVETIVYLVDMETWQEVGRVHGEYFSHVRPANTIIQVGPLIVPALMVEISVRAWLDK